MNATLDHPLVRSDVYCCICHQPKLVNLLVCWPCWRKHHLRLGNPEIERSIARQEAHFARRQRA